jgi:hypothetical protein
MVQTITKMLNDYGLDSVVGYLGEHIHGDISQDTVTINSLITIAIQLFQTNNRRMAIDY